MARVKVYSIVFYITRQTLKSDEITFTAQAVENVEIIGRLNETIDGYCKTSLADAATMTQIEQNSAAHDVSLKQANGQRLQELKKLSMSMDANSCLLERVITLKAYCLALLEENEGLYARFEELVLDTQSFSSFAEEAKKFSAHIMKM